MRKRSLQTCLNDCRVLSASSLWSISSCNLKQKHVNQRGTGKPPGAGRPHPTTNAAKPRGQGCCDTSTDSRDCDLWSSWQLSAGVSWSWGTLEKTITALPYKYGQSPVPASQMHLPSLCLESFTPILSSCLVTVSPPEGSNKLSKSSMEVLELGGKCSLQSLGSGWGPLPLRSSRQPPPQPHPQGRGSPSAGPRTPLPPPPLAWVRSYFSRSRMMSSARLSRSTSTRALSLVS